MDQQLWQKCVEFHGHECPGLAIGFKACEAAKKKLGISFSKDEEIVCATENDACGVDAVQVITGCTLGKGNLIYRGTGKNAYTFFRRDTGEKLRVVLKPNNGSKDLSRKERQQAILKSPVEELFEFKNPGFDLPQKARLFNTLICEKCGEGAPEHKIRIMDDKKVCLDCFEDYSRGW
jgi:formylmethanofuran dehydrogenase subunit E